MVDAQGRQHMPAEHLVDGARARYLCNGITGLGVPGLDEHMLPPSSEDTLNYEDENNNASNHSANPKSGRAGCAGAVRHLKDIEHGLRADLLYAVIPYFIFQSFKAEEPRPAVAQVQVTYRGRIKEIYSVLQHSIQSIIRPFASWRR